MVTFAPSWPSRKPAGTGPPPSAAPMSVSGDAGIARAADDGTTPGGDPPWSAAQVRGPTMPSGVNPRAA